MTDSPLAVGRLLFDGALHVVARLRGADAAQWTASEWLEHTPAK